MEKGNQTTIFIFLAFTNATRFSTFFFILFLVIYLVILLVNVLLIMIIKADTKLHTPMYFFIFNLSCMDICYTSSVVPQTLHNLLLIRPSISFLRCAAQMVCIVGFGGVQIFLITAMAYDRYVAICNPLRYNTVMSWAMCRTLLALVWMSSSIIAFTMVFSIFLLPFCGLFELDHFFCDVGQVFHLTCPSKQVHDMVETLDFFLALCLFTIPFLLVLITYICIISSILKIQTNKGRYKAFSTCSSHLTIVVVEYVWLGVMYFQTDKNDSVDKNRVLVVTFLFFSPLLNPLIYSVRNKAVKNGFITLFYKTSTPS